MKNQKGFSLVELLVVVIIIAIVAAIAIPNLLASRRAANEAAAIASLRTIHSAQATYNATKGGGVAYSSLANLGTETLIDSTLAGGQKSNYNFAVTLGTDNYCGTATPVGTSGDRSFAVSGPGVIYAIAGSSAPTCTATTGVISSGSPIQ